MRQLFSPRADRRLRITLGLALCGVVVAAAAGFALARSDRIWGVGVAAPQPIPFSHAVHAGEVGLDCRYCHAGVERQAAAGMPTAETCLGCHGRVWNVAAQFAPLETAISLGQPVQWASVHRLPDHVRFHHGAHSTAGVGCETCHGQVWTMPRTVKAQTLSMGWCLDCHRSPGPRLRPPEAIFDREWSGEGAAAPAAAGAGAPPLLHSGIEISPLTRCSTCHR
jgi:hypothetical protein